MMFLKRGVNMNNLYMQEIKDKGYDVLTKEEEQTLDIESSRKTVMLVMS